MWSRFLVTATKDKKFIRKTNAPVESRFNQKKSTMNEKNESIAQYVRETFDFFVGSNNCMINSASRLESGFNGKTTYLKSKGKKNANETKSQSKENPTDSNPSPHESDTEEVWSKPQAKRKTRYVRPQLFSSSQRKNAEPPSTIVLPQPSVASDSSVAEISLSDTEPIAQVDDIVLYRKDFEDIFVGSRFLSDSHVDAYIRYLLQTTPHNSHFATSSLMISESSRDWSVCNELRLRAREELPKNVHILHPLRIKARRTCYTFIHFHYL